MKITDNTWGSLEVRLARCKHSASAKYLRKELDERILCERPGYVVFPLGNGHCKLYDRGNYESINTHLEQFYTDYEREFHSRSVETNWELLVDKLNELTETFVPSITIKNKVSAPWFNNSIKKLINRKKRLFKSAKTKNQPSLWKAYSEAVKRLSITIQSAKRDFFDNASPHAQK